MIPKRQRCQLIDARDQTYSISEQCQLLGVHRSMYYYRPKGVSARDLAIMKQMDRMYWQDPTRGSRRWRADLALAGISISRGKARRLMGIMGITAVGAKVSTSRSDPAAYKYPYLLRGLAITRVNQVWQIDISYIPLKRGFMYLVAIIDVYSRYLVGWSLSNTMEAEWVTDCVKQTVQRHGKPQIINSDQGPQFTSIEYVECIKALKTTKLSMDGKGRATDNAYIERFFRSIKYEKLYLHEPRDGKELYELCESYVTFYNRQRAHSSIENLTPWHYYHQVA